MSDRRLGYVAFLMRELMRELQRLIEDPSTGSATRELARGLLRSLDEFQGLVEGAEPEPPYPPHEPTIRRLHHVLRETQRWQDRTTTKLAFIQEKVTLAADLAGLAFSITHLDCSHGGDAPVDGEVEDGVLYLKCDNDKARWEVCPLTSKP